MTSGAGGVDGCVAGPLAGVRVLDLTTVLAGPYCTYHLALLGADVLKVEAPGHGDRARNLGADASLSARGLGSSFLAQNAGKRSTVIDLKTDTGRQRFLGLADAADVVVESFRPGVMDRLGVGPAALQERNPTLVFCSVSGFGQHGPRHQQRAYDQIIQGLSGIMSLTGTAATAPLRTGFPVCDTMAGTAAAFAICAALVGRRPGQRAPVLDVSMLEVAVSSLGWALSDSLIGGQPSRPRGNDNPTAAPSGTFRTADGMINIASNQQVQFERLCDALGAADLAADPRFADGESRKLHRNELTVCLERLLSKRGSAEWIECLGAAGVPVGEVLSVADVMRMPYLHDDGFFEAVPMPGEADRTVTVAGSWLHVDGHRPRPTGAPPLLGEHDEAPWRASPEADAHKEAGHE